jgi:hypothetical protein
MVQGSRSKSRKNINPRRREEGYVLTQGGEPNPTQPNPRVVRRRSSSSSSSRNGKTDGEKYHASKSTATVPRRDHTPTRRRACPPFRSPPRSRSIERSRHHPRNPGGGSSRCARASNARTPAGGDALAGKKGKGLFSTVAGGLFSSSSSSSEFFPFPPSLPFPRIELGEDFNALGVPPPSRHRRYHRGPYPIICRRENFFS